jgi:hypothetical protein
MQYQAVSSSSIAAVGYDLATGTLGVRFQNGSEYHYHGVPKRAFEALRSAGSVGTYMNTHIKTAGYPYTRIS